MWFTGGNTNERYEERRQDFVGRGSNCAAPLTKFQPAQWGALE